MCVGPELVHRSESAKGAGGKKKGERKGRNNLGRKEAKEVEVGTKTQFRLLLSSAVKKKKKKKEALHSRRLKLGSSPSNLELQASTKTTQTLHSKQEEEEEEEGT